MVKLSQCAYYICACVISKELVKRHKHPTTKALLARHNELSNDTYEE